MSVEKFKRKSLSPKKRQELGDLHGWACWKCGKNLQPDAGDTWQADHVIPFGLTGKSGAKHLEEYRPICLPCHKEKSKADNKTVKRANRKAKKHAGTYSKKKKKIQNRPFPKPHKASFSSQSTRDKYSLEAIQRRKDERKGK